jgi:hypothetical protein
MEKSINCICIAIHDFNGSRSDNDETGVTGEISGSMRKCRRIAARNPLCHNHFHGELVAAGLASEP